MNDIKRKKEEEEGDAKHLLEYKFGLYKNPKSVKLIDNSKVNKRILIDKFDIIDALKFDYPEKIIKKLIMEDNLDMITKNGDTPLHIAIKLNRSEEIIKMLSTEKNLNMQNDVENTPLHVALGLMFRLFQNRIILKTTIIEALITKENVNIKNGRKETPLHAALRSSYNDYIINLLITKENIFIKDVVGRTPHMICLEKIDFSKELSERLSTIKNDYFSIKVSNEQY